MFVSEPLERIILVKLHSFQSCCEHENYKKKKGMRVEGDAVGTGGQGRTFGA
jgi:hypothetical protein